jgi:hypothetical protein
MIQSLVSTLILSLAVVISCSNGEMQNESAENQKENLNKDLQVHGLNGKVKSIDEYIVNPETNEKMDSFFKEFNKNGILVTIKNSVGNHSDLFEITCDGKGIPISGKRETTAMDGQQQIYTYAYKCTSGGLIMEEKLTHDLFESTDYILYNKDGFETSRRSFVADMLSSVDTTSYDEKNRVIRFAHLDPETLQPTYEVLTTYQEKAREITETWYSNGILSGTKKRTEELDDFENPISVRTISGEDSTTVFIRYKYDDQNNWTEKTTYKGETIVLKWKRDITYY